MEINQIMQQSFETAKDKGWIVEGIESNKAEYIALMHSELSEALEAIREPDIKDKHLPHLDPVGVELADAVIRICNYCEEFKIDLDTCVAEKLAYNADRPFKYGGKLF